MLLSPDTSIYQRLDFKKTTTERDVPFQWIGLNIPDSGTYNIEIKMMSDHDLVDFPFIKLHKPSRYLHHPTKILKNEWVCFELQFDVLERDELLNFIFDHFEDSICISIAYIKLVKLFRTVQEGISVHELESSGFHTWKTGDLIVNKTTSSIFDIFKANSCLLNPNHWVSVDFSPQKFHAVLSFDIQFLSPTPTDATFFVQEKYGVEHTRQSEWLSVCSQDQWSLVTVPMILDNPEDTIIQFNMCDCKKELRFQIRNMQLLPRNCDHMPVRIVVARYNEDVRWTKQFCNLLIINKGPPLEVGYDTINYPNVGREGHTYYRYIVDNYDNLSEFTVFLQGNPFDHSPNIIERLHNYNTGGGCHPDLTFEDLSHYILDCNLAGCPHHAKLPLIPIYYYLFGIRRTNFHFQFGGGAQFIVSRSQILKQPKAFYMKVLNILQRHINPIEGFVIERFHPLIFRDIH